MCLASAFESKQKVLNPVLIASTSLMNPRFLRWHLVDPRTPLGTIHPLIVAIDRPEHQAGLLTALGITGTVTGDLKSRLKEPVQLGYMG
jgi:hypothetical protein